jgi:hypothetical protein
VRLATDASNLWPSLHKFHEDGIFAGASDILVLTGVRSPGKRLRRLTSEKSPRRTMSDEHVDLLKLKRRGGNGVVLDVQRGVTWVVGLRVRPKHHFQSGFHTALY